MSLASIVVTTRRGRGYRPKNFTSVVVQLFLDAHRCLEIASELASIARRGSSILILVPGAPPWRHTVTGAATRECKARLEADRIRLHAEQIRARVRAADAADAAKEKRCA